MKYPYIDPSLLQIVAEAAKMVDMVQGSLPDARSIAAMDETVRAAQASLGALRADLLPTYIQAMAVASEPRLAGLISLSNDIQSVHRHVIADVLKAIEVRDSLESSLVAAFSRSLHVNAELFRAASSAEVKEVIARVSELRDELAETSREAPVQPGLNETATAKDAPQVHEALAQLSDVATPGALLVLLSKLRPFLSKEFLAFLISIYVNYFVSIKANLDTPLWEQLLGSNHVETRSQVVRDMREAAGRQNAVDALSEHRFVVARVLRVRCRPSTSAPQLGAVRRGQIVHVIELRDQWAFVEFLSKKSGRALRGWVKNSSLASFAEPAD